MGVWNRFNSILEGTHEEEMKIGCGRPEPENKKRRSSRLGRGSPLCREGLSVSGGDQVTLLSAASPCCEISPNRSKKEKSNRQKLLDVGTWRILRCSLF